MDIRAPLLITAALALASLGACTAPADPAPSAQPAPGDARSAPAQDPPSPPAASTGPEAAPPANGAPAAEPASSGFAPAPAKGWIVRANCRMGGCWWYRFDEVKREGTAEMPRYSLRLTGGESTHAQDPYPASAQGVDIKWDAKSAAATVACSHAAPKVAYEGDARTLKLNPRGVSGVEQGIANLYFATCHGEYGDDGKLAAKYGYDAR